MDDLISATSTYTPEASGEGYLTRRLGCNIGCQTGWNHYYLPTDPVPDFTNDPEFQRLRAQVDARRAEHGGRPSSLDPAMDGLTSATSMHTPRASGESDLRRRRGLENPPSDPVPDYTNDPLWQRLRAEVDAARAAHGGKSPPYFPEFSDSSTELERFPLTPFRTPPPPPRPPQLRSSFHSTPPSSEKAISHQRDPEDPTTSASNAMSITSPKSIQWPHRRPTTRSRRAGTFFSLGNTYGRIVKQSGKQRSQLSYAQVVKALGSSFSRIETATNWTNTTHS